MIMKTIKRQCMKRKVINTIEKIARKNNNN